MWLACLYRPCKTTILDLTEICIDLIWIWFALKSKHQVLFNLAEELKLTCLFRRVKAQGFTFHQILKLGACCNAVMHQSEKSSASRCWLYSVRYSYHKVLLPLLDSRARASTFRAASRHLSCVLEYNQSTESTDGSMDSEESQRIVHCISVDVEIFIWLSEYMEIFFPSMYRYFWQKVGFW